MKQILNTQLQTIKTHLDRVLRHSVSFKVFVLLAMVTLAVSLPWPGMQARQTAFQRGDVFVSLTDGLVQRYSQTSGALLQTLDTATGSGSFITGGAFDRNANFYATAFSTQTVVRFDTNGTRLGEFGSGYNGRPESIIFDADGNAYVGSVDGDNDVRKFDAAGNPLDRYDVAVERRGSDWIDLAADKCTLFYTSEGARIMRFDVCTKIQLSDFVNNLPHSAAYAVRLLPGGGLLVADSNEVLRLDATGNITQRYDAPGEDSWFAVNLDPDGTSFWSGGISTGNVYKFDIASGNQITRIPTGQGAIFGVTVLGELTVVNPTPSPTATVTPTATPTPTPPTDLTDISLTSGAGSGISFQDGSVATPNGLLRYRIGVANRGPNVARGVMLFNTLPANTSLVDCSASHSGTCALDGRNLKITYPVLPVGEAAIANISVRVNCTEITVSTLTISASTMAVNPDPNETNNATTASAQVAPPQPRITLGSPGGFNFGEVQLRREGLANPQWYPFSIENLGCLPLTVGFAVQRTGADVSSGRINNANDQVTFPLALVANGTVQFLTSEAPLTIPGGGRGEYRLYFNPKIPMAAGKTSGLSANQVIPDLINSLFTIATNAPSESGPPRSFSYPVTGRVTPEVKLINPLTPSLPPLVVLARNSDEFSVEFSVHDANLDTYCATYQFLNEGDVPVGDAPVFYLDEDLAKANLVRGQSFTVVKKFSGANRRPEVRRVRVTVHDRQVNVVDTSGPVGSQHGRVVNVSAASFAASGLAVESIVAAFGSRLAVETRTAGSTPLPLELAGTRVLITDSNNVERAAPLFFVAPGQVNYMVPRGTATGPALVTIAAADGALSTGNITIADVAPALFTADASGKGLPTGLVLRVKTDGAQVYEALSRYDAAARRFEAVAINVSNAKEQVFAVLFGTGFRYRRAPQALRATVGGLEVPIVYAGAQGGLAGVDQVNLLLPSQLAGRGEAEIQLFVDGKAANAVRVQIR